MVSYLVPVRISGLLSSMSTAEDVHDLYKIYAEVSALLQNYYYDLRHSLMRGVTHG